MERALANAVLATVAYADCFDFPLTSQEIWRRLIGIAAPPEAVIQAVTSLIGSGRLWSDGQYAVLPHRDGLAALRSSRMVRARRLWRAAMATGHLLASMPFVRAVAITGSLAAGNPDPRADIDFLLVTAPDHLWTARAVAIVLVRLAHRLHISLCPNYVLSTRALALERQDLFTASELLQAVPVAGHDVFREMVHRNGWAQRHLPNYFGERLRDLDRLAHEPQHFQPGRSWPQGAQERLFDYAPFSQLERWEANRKIATLHALHPHALFTADVCEGHYGRSRSTSLTAFEQRCQRLGVLPSSLDLNESADHGQRAPRPVVLSAV